jgi:putative endonuclease
MPFTVYVIKAKNGDLYKGVTHNLDKRLESHNQGWRWTKGRGPFILLYKEEYSTKTEALKREKFFKSGQGREFLKKRLLVSAGLGA